MERLSGLFKLTHRVGGRTLFRIQEPSSSLLYDVAQSKQEHDYSSLFLNMLKFLTILSQNNTYSHVPRNDVRSTTDRVYDSGAMRLVPYSLGVQWAVLSRFA